MSLSFVIGKSVWYGFGGLCFQVFFRLTFIYVLLCCLFNLAVAFVDGLPVFYSLCCRWFHSSGSIFEPAVLIGPVTWWCCWLLRTVSHNLVIRLIFMSFGMYAHAFVPLYGVHRCFLGFP